MGSNKQLYPLEAFRRFRHNAKFDNKSDYFLSTNYIDDNDIIENALKEYEKMDYHYLKVRDLDKKLKALEIIKNKPQIEITYIQWGKIKTYDEYLKKVHEWDLEEHGDMELTQEEHGLLKEVLL